MAFVISKKQSYAWPVKVKTPNGGKWETHTFTATFKRLPPLDVQDWLKQIAETDLAAEERYDRENRFIDDVLMGWEGVSDDGGIPLPFTPENKALVMDIIEVRRALFDAFFESALGKRAEAKN